MAKTQRDDSDASLSLSAAISGRRSPLSWSVTDDQDEGTVTVTGYRSPDWRPVHDQEPVCEYTLTPRAAELAVEAIENGCSIEGALHEECCRETHERGELCRVTTCDECDNARRRVARLDARERILEDRGDWLRDEGKDERIGGGL